MRARRRLLPWRSRTRRWMAGVLEIMPSSAVDDPISAVLGAIAMILLLPLLVLWLLESLAQWIALPFVLLARLSGAAAVPLIVTERGQVAHRESVDGWAEADARLEAMRREIDHGSPHPWRDRSDPWTSSDQPGW